MDIFDLLLTIPPCVLLVAGYIEILFYLTKQHDDGGNK